MKIKVPDDFIEAYAKYNTEPAFREVVDKHEEDIKTILHSPGEYEVEDRRLGI